MQSIKTKPLRDEKGRFMKAPLIHNGIDEISKFDFTVPQTAGNVTITLVPEGKLAKLRRLISHHRLAIAYVIICLLAGALGGYLGVTVGL